MSTTPQPAIPDPSHIRRALDARGVKKVKIGGFDIDGILRGKFVSLEKFQSAAESGLGFCDVIFGWDSGDILYDNARVTGWHTGYPDALARVDLSTLRVIPWEPDTACFLLDFFTSDGKPHPASPRAALRRVADKAHAMGLLPKASCEYEFFFFKETPHSLREKGYRGLVPLSPGMFGYSWLRESEHSELVHALIDGLAEFDVELEGFHTETGPGVYEAAIRYDKLVRAGDKAALFKTAAKEIGARRGLIATFMAKWSEGLPGCGGHLHQSLWDAAGEKNLFADAAGPRGMSQIMRWYVGGQVKLMPELCALVAPTVNSYKRLVPNTWAPTAAHWGFENRTTALRVIAGMGPSSMRVEYRLSGADVSPHLALAASVGAGLWGIENKVEPPAPVDGNAYEAKDAAPLPRTLAEATQLLKKSAAARQILGEACVDHFVRTREWEVRQFEHAVTGWELSRYFEII
jgi:glutamine synthetase